MRLFIFILFYFIYSTLWARDVKIAPVSATNDNFIETIKNNEIVVKFNIDLLEEINISRAFNEGKTDIARLDALAESFNIVSLKQRYPQAKTKDVYGERMNLRGWFKVVLNDSVNVLELVQNYKLISGVIDAQPIGIHSFDVVTPNDPFYSPDMWYLNQVSDHDVDAAEAWDIQMGNPDIIVADLDSGFRYYHGDLGGVNASYSNPENSRGNMWTNNLELNGTPGVDDDSNGYIDDWIGWDFVTGNPQFNNEGDDYDIEDNDPSDHNGHGTHTIGTIGAITNNGYAVSSISGGNGETAGVGNGVKVMGLRIGWTDRYPIIGEVGRISMDFAANAFIYAADNGAQIASCSWGSSNSGGLEDAINYFLYGTTSPTGNEPRLGLIFKSAGNDDDEVSDYMTDRLDIIAVASTDQNDVKSDFSTYGTWVDISAPGTDILSTYELNTDPASDYVATLSGTSMATPCVASVAALVWSHNPALNPDEIEQMLYDTADEIENIPDNSAYVGKLGAGRVNAFTAIQQADISLPVELTAFTATVNKGVVQLNWSTGSELENVGFDVLRSNLEDGKYNQIAGYQSNDNLRGLGTAAYGQDYLFLDFNVDNGHKYWYKLRDIDINGQSREHGPVSILVNTTGNLAIESSLIPKNYALSENFPNPFNPTTSFKIDVPQANSEASKITVIIHDVLGKKIKTLWNGPLAPGIYTLTWNGLNDLGVAMPSGMYIYSAYAKGFSQTKKMILMK